MYCLVDCASFVLFLNTTTPEQMFSVESGELDAFIFILVTLAPPSAAYLGGGHGCVRAV